MYVLYLDESGDPNGWSTRPQNHFVIGGIAVHEGQIHTLTSQLDQIQNDFFPGIRVPIAFHASDIRNGRDRFRQLLEADRVRLLDSVYSVLRNARFPNLIAFATAMHISCVVSADQVLHDTFGDVCMRFNTFLVRQYNAGYKDKGLLVIDQAHEESYRHLVADFQRSGTSHGYLGNVVDIPYFAGRRDTRMLQLADFCASAVYQHYEHNDSVHFHSVFDRFDRKLPRRQPPDGLKHLTRLQCACEACYGR